MNWRHLAQYLSAHVRRDVIAIGTAGSYPRPGSELETDREKVEPNPAITGG